MAYGNYGYNNRGGGYNNQRPQQNGGYNQQGQSNFQPQPQRSPQEFIQKRIEIYKFFLQEIEASGIPKDEVLMQGGLMGWVTSYLLEQKKGK